MSRLIRSLYAPLDRFAYHRPRPIELFDRRPVVIGHRGAAGLRPENTMEAFEEAAALGVPFELDVHRIRSGELVVLHDDTLDRTTAGQGPVRDQPIERLREVGVPTLDEVLEHFGRRVVIDVEIKTTDDKLSVAEAVVRTVQTHGLERRVLVTSFDPFILDAVRRADPSLRRGQLIGRFAGTNLAWYERLVLRNLLLNYRAQPDLIAAEHSLLSEEYIDRLHGRGYCVLAWTVNRPETMDHLAALGVDGLITDRPDVALARLCGADKIGG